MKFLSVIQLVLELPVTPNISSPLIVYAGSTIKLLSELLKVIPKENVAVHFHDTYGQALANIVVALQVALPIECNMSDEVDMVLSLGSM